MNNSARDYLVQGLRRRWEYKKTFYVFLFIVIFFLLFKEWTGNAINTILVKPLFSTIKNSDWTIDFLFVTGIVVVMLNYVKKAIKGVRISSFVEGLVLTTSFIYLYYRIIVPDRFRFVTFKIKFLNQFFLADIIIATFWGLLLYNVLRFFRYKYFNLSSLNSSEGFYTDSSKILDEKNDFLSRRPYVERLKDMILATQSTNHSFAIGIIGEWGTGKTTFLRTLEKELSKNKEILIMPFNPWLASSAEGITSIFFSDLAKSVSKYDNSLKSDLLSYARELLQTIDNVNISAIKTFMNNFSQDNESIEKQEKINKSIQRLSKKIVVPIDDLDRLTKTEVFEVLKIIRNSANFANIFFLVAFDRVYVKKSLGEVLVSKMEEEYLDKIFHLEYYLPINTNINVYKNDLIQRLKKVVNSANAKVLDQLENPQENLTKIEFNPPIRDYIKSFRDVERFMNVFLLNYSQIENNIYLPDYITICILRLKFPEVYRLLYYNTYHFLTKSIASGYYESDERLNLQFEDKQLSDLKNTKLFSFLSERSSHLHLEVYEIEKAVGLVNSIFPPRSNISRLTHSRTLYNNHLSVTSQLSFNRYFDFSMAGRLDQKEFNEIMNEPIEDIEKKFGEWNQLRSTNTDLAVKLENFNADNKEMFEKYINSLVYYANLVDPDNDYRLNQFNYSNLYYLIGRDDERPNKVIDKFYKGEKELFKIFFKTLFVKDLKFERWGFLQEFSKYLIENYHDNSIFKHDELMELIKERFLLNLNSANKISSHILWYYLKAVRLFQVAEIDSNLSVTLSDRSLQMSKKLQVLIQSDFHEFLVRNIYWDERSQGYLLDKWPIYIFGSQMVFDDLLRQKGGGPYIDEYIYFCNEYKKHDRPIPFNFVELKLPA